MSVKVGLRFCSKIVACGLLLASLLPVSVQAEALSWKQQLGSSLADTSEDVATDSNGNVYITGYTEGSLAGPNNAGIDAWVAKYDSSGKLLWKQQLGLFGPRVTFVSVATDSLGNVYVSGGTDGSLAGASQGKYDALVVKYNSSGNLVWKRQLGTSDDEGASAVATDNLGNVYISGDTRGSLARTNNVDAEGYVRNDAWVAKYTSSGDLLWKRQLGSSNDDYSNGAATDSNGNIYISGYTSGALAGTNNAGEDAWVAKYNSSGDLLWKQQLGLFGSFVFSYDVATDRFGNVYLCGMTSGSLGGDDLGREDAWVAKYNTSGTLVWKQQIGTSKYDTAKGVATDSNGNVYISGMTLGSLGGPYKGMSDAWVAKYSNNGALMWKKQLGASGSDRSNSVATDNNSNVYISGYTEGNLGLDSHASRDAWVAKYTR